jgi:hypothetical protein
MNPPNHLGGALDPNMMMNLGVVALFTCDVSAKTVLN